MKLSYMFLLCPYIYESIIRDSFSSYIQSMTQDYFPCYQLSACLSCTLQFAKMLCPQIKITVPHGLISHYLCFLSIFPKSGMKLFQLNNNKKNSPLDLPKPRKRQISMYYSVKKTSGGDYPKYSLLLSFREATFQKNKQNNMLKTVLNTQLLRISSHLLFKAACQVVFLSRGDLDGSPFSKPFTKKGYSSVVEHVTGNPSPGQRALSLSKAGEACTSHQFSNTEKPGSGSGSLMWLQQEEVSPLLFKSQIYFSVDRGMDHKK